MVLKPFYTPPRRAMTVHQAIRLARAAAAAAGRERGELAPLPRKTRIIPTRKVRPHRGFELYRAREPQPRDDARQSRNREGIRGRGLSRTTRRTLTDFVSNCPCRGRDRGEKKSS